MKNKSFLILLAFACVVSFVSCKKEKDPLASADFTYKSISHGGVEVTFTGKGTHNWNFGGNDKGYLIGKLYDNTVKFYYKENGSHTIKLSATNASETDEKSQEINITGVPTTMKITKVKLYSFRETNNAGDPWDNDATGPDVTFKYFHFGTAAISGQYSNLAESDLPISFVPSVNLSYPISTSVGINIFMTDDGSSESIENIMVNNFPSSSSCESGCDNFIYPAKLSSKRNGNKTIEVELEWLP